MGIGSSDCYPCNENDCTDLIACRRSRNQNENEKETDSYDTFPRYRIFQVPEPNFTAKTEPDGKQSIPCCHNHLKESSNNRNQESEIRCCCRSPFCNHALSISSCQSSTRSPASQIHHSHQQRPISFYNNISGDRHNSGEQRRGPIPPFPSVDALSTGLNNSKEASNSNLASRYKEAKNVDANVHHSQRRSEARKVPNNFQNLSRPGLIHANETLSNSTCSENNLGKMNTNHESFILSASSQADMEEWVKVIKRLILSPFGGGIFGQRLDETMRHDRRINVGGNASARNKNHQASNREVPIIVENCVEFIRSRNGLREEGLFRLPGQANEVKELQDAYDLGERPVFSKSTDIHTIASLLKGYLRELPEPVIPFDRYHALIEAAKLSKSGEESPKSGSGRGMSKEEEEALKQIRDQILLFPQINYDLLKYMCRFLDEVQRHSKYNKMDTYNLSMVFGPNMMRARQEDAVSMMTDTALVQHVIYQLIDHYEYVFSDDTNRTEILNGDVVDELADDINENGDAGIGTLTTTASPLGTLGPRHANDDSGTGSLAPTPDNTNKRTPALPNVHPPNRRTNKPARPNKPLRSKPSNPNLANGTASSLPPSCDEDVRRSYYDNVTNSSTGSPELAASADDWRRISKDSSEFSGENANSISQDSYYVNNQSTPSSSSMRSSTHAVAGSACPPESCFSSTTAETLSDPRMRFQPRSIRRPKSVRHRSRNLSDEESNTESVGTEDRPFSTISSRSSCNNIDHPKLSNHPRTSSCPTLKYSNNAGTTSPSRCHPTGSGSDGGSSNSSVPTAPARFHRRIKNESGGVNAAQHDSNHSILPPGSTRSSNMTSLGTSASSRPLTYKEMEEQIRALTEELNKQRQEHEKRSRMLEEHYVMKMTGSSPSFTAPMVSLDPYSSAGFLHHHHPSYSIKEAEDLAGSPADSIALRGMNTTDESALDPMDSCYFQHTPSAVSRALSNESQQAEMRYREEMKRHAITKIRLRNTERALRQAEERNEQLQKEMENFFETFGSMLPQ